MSKLLHTGAGIALLICALPLHSHDPITTKLTWTEEISRIVYKRCVGCHRPSGAAFSLTTYDDARPWAKAIRDEVCARRMPPWGAVKGIGDFAGDPSLSSPEIDMLVAWVEGGAPEGDPAYLPHRIPDAAGPAPASPDRARSVIVTKETTLSHAARLAALRPKDLADGGSLEAWAVKPDGSVERLIWLADYRKAWTRDYVLREQIALPAGTRLRVQTQQNASLLFRFE